MLLSAPSRVDALLENDGKNEKVPFYKKVAERTIETYGNSAPITLEGIGGISYLSINTMRFLFAGVNHS